ncbi:hypothetical protein RO03_07350 [Fusobacterium nucleatum subsp. nucleatum]|uniref:Uncharacterized protein n=1 Tax=Fusobacterium nucleatum subsp. nucleatum TaxID=76856 RepID=A0A0X3Y401_FUSNC|nr:hypothetical protein [Fusobacterium nucleatum]ALF24731.1 hypothetical protein RO05_10255 [Fusobacterium nucleatum subsp. nucleatum ChDC F316]ASG26033.1 hypothetical protein RN84_03620 [Fusobacterium nucleatum subsp. nucleatum]KUL99326.1 hypothetical protein RO03_07350 [Fusobacterium nucleatum subsp. nucleatum]
MSILEKLHTDRVTVVRSVTITDEYGGAFEELREILKDIPCRLSQKLLRGVSLGPVNSSLQEYKLFVGLDVDIKQNDLLKVTRKADGELYIFKASKPLAYNIIKHKEIALIEVSENEVDYGA